MRYACIRTLTPARDFAPLIPIWKTSISSIFRAEQKLRRRRNAMKMFWEFFTFELRLRRKSISTYVYFVAWFLFSFLCVASENFGPIGSGNEIGRASCRE